MLFRLRQCLAGDPFACLATRPEPWIFVFLSTCLTVLPIQTFYAASRLSLIRALLESIVAPMTQVTFWHVIVADYLTSLAKAFSDVQVYPHSSIFKQFSNAQACPIAESRTTLRATGLISQSPCRDVRHSSQCASLAPYSPHRPMSMATTVARSSFGSSTTHIVQAPRATL